MLNDDARVPHLVGYAYKFIVELINHAECDLETVHITHGYWTELLTRNAIKDFTEAKEEKFKKFPALRSAGEFIRNLERDDINFLGCYKRKIFEYEKETPREQKHNLKK